MSYTTKLFYALLLACLGLLTACQSHQQSDKDTLMVSIEPARYVVEAIAGEQFKVETMMPQGASPETYEPVPRQMIEMQHCKAFFRIGSLGFENTIVPKLVESAPQLPLFDLNKNVALISSKDHCCDGLHSLDPHVWMSASNLIEMANNACEALCLIDSLHADYYKHRLDSFTVAMNQLHLDLKTQTNRLQHRAFLIYHPALGYLARDYGLQQIAVENDGKEPTAASLKLLINHCRAMEVKAVFISQEHSGDAAKRIADALHTQVHTINPLAYDVPAQLRDIAKYLCQ